MPIRIYTYIDTLVPICIYIRDRRIYNVTIIIYHFIFILLLNFILNYTSQQ